MANEIDPSIPWDITAGGIPSIQDTNTAAQTFVLPPRGIFAAYPGATPKYATNEGEQETDFRETMARMFLQVPNYKTFLESLLGEDGQTQQIATVLAGQASETGGTSGGNGYIDFLLQSIQHSFQEKVQVSEVLADEHVAYFFGQHAPTFNYTGTLINTKQDDQAANMLRLYSKFGRGSQLAARNTLISLRYDGLFVSGVMMNLNYSMNAEIEMAIPFNFSLLVKRYQILPNPYSGLVSLSKPFAVAADKYLPFSQGSLNTGVVLAAPAMTPGTAAAAIVPASTEATTKEKQEKEDNEQAGLLERMTINTNLKTKFKIAAKLIHLPGSEFL